MLSMRDASILRLNQRISYIIYHKPKFNKRIIEYEEILGQNSETTKQTDWYTIVNLQHILNS